MSVHAVNHTADLHRMTPLGQLARNVAGQKTGAVPLDETVNTEAPALRSIAEEVEVTTPEDSKDEDGKAGGVLRNLEAGHFKGVADVRLRINFFDQLSARAETAAGAVIEERSQELVESIAAKVNELVGPLAADEETNTALETLVVNFGTAVEEAARGSTLDRDALAEALQSAFGELVTRMTDLLSAPPDEDESPDEVTAPASGTLDENIPAETDATSVSNTLVEPIDEQLTDIDGMHLAAQADTVGITPNDLGDAADAQPAPTTPTLEDAIAALGNIFEEALAGLLTSVNEAAQLGEPSQPSGNGVAYERFLAIYNGLRGLSPTIDERA